MRISHLHFAFGFALSSIAQALPAHAQGVRAPAPPPAAPPPPAPPPVAPPTPAPSAPSGAAPAAAPAAPSAAPTAPAAPPAPGAAPAPAEAAPPPVAPDAPPAVPPPPPATVPAARPVEPLPPPVPAPDLTIRRHDGFYLRMGLGGGFMGSKVDYPTGDLSARGTGVAVEFALGGTVAEGLVIGGGLYSQSTENVRWKGESLRTRFESDTYSHDKQATIALLGVFLDYYPNPKDGFHVQGGLGIGTLSYEADSVAGFPGETWGGAGGGGMLGVGYEAWIGSQWSLGGVARLLVASGSLRGEDTDLTFDAKGYAPSLLLVATHH